MVQKRNNSQANDGGSEFPGPESKRQHPSTKLFTGLGNYSSLEELAQRLEPSIRHWAREEIDKVLQSTLRSSLNDIDTAQSRDRDFQLRFDHNFPSTFFTGSKIESVDNRPIKILLLDANTHHRITSGPLSSIKVGVVVVDGDFNPNDQEWTKEEFCRRVVRERQGKRPLLTGDLTIQLRDGVGYLGDISFTDNSSWRRSRTFRLGLKLISRSGESVVREGVSKSFTVKDHRGESYKKHHPPSLDDQTWRLEKIAKDGPSHKRLSREGVLSVKDFLRLYITNPSALRTMMACGLSNNMWEKTTEHARTCVLDNNECYVYKAAESIVLVFNCIYEVVGAILDGQNFQPLEKLDEFQKRVVEDLKRRVYKNLNCLVLLEDHSHIPTSSQQNINYSVEHGQLELLGNSDYSTISPPLAYTVQQDSPSALSMPESFHGMQAFNSTLGRSFSISDPGCSIYSGSIESLGMMDYSPLENNFQYGTTAWPGNELLASSSIQPVSPNFGFHITKRGNPRAPWCIIRAVLKWKTLVKRNVAV